ncbi:hypothetical protein OU426_00590 [Frigidibacter sp. RF13]|uniref:hypothetical protein n=1 Tax=Frigidibacter sp. RF13 TaxID=2997340 RepID=UPI00226F288C|nr:hypothetical protein [Frigidibacter sp. RF13]MCY1125339.1 hypothetical protein [Frigidibacter sp. RF13]
MSKATERAARALGLGLAIFGAAGIARGEGADQAPLSAIDWLSQSVATPATLPRGPIAVPQPQAGSPAPTGLAPPPADTITVTPLNRQAPVALGLVSAARSGLPPSLWGTTPSSDLARHLRAERPDTLPAMRSLLYALLITELSPPADNDPQNALFLARIDRLLDLGALEPALAILELMAKPDPESFRRWFDASLLVGEEDRACRVMRATPEIAPTFPARIFCLARGGDWNAAALALRTGETLGTIDPGMAELLARFLDPELADGAEDLPLPDRPSPLVLRMMEAIGQPLPTVTLPVAFAQADLRSNSGWKARIEAGERLARVGAIPPNRLMGLYSEQRAAASGGVWERVKAVQALDQALAEGDMEATITALDAAWAQMTPLELEVPFAELFGVRLANAELKGEAGALAFRVALLSQAYEALANRREPADMAERFLIGVARGDTTGLTPPDQLGVAIQHAFSDPEPPLPPQLATLLADKKLGEAILKAIDAVTQGASGDLRDVTGGLALLRKVGLEQAARQAALDLLLLERRG